MDRKGQKPDQDQKIIYGRDQQTRFYGPNPAPKI